MFRKTTAWAILAAMLCRPAFAHPISLTTAQAVVATNGVDARIDVMLEDFMLFYGLMPADDNLVAPKDIEGGIERHKAFLLRDFIIRDRNGERLEGSVVKVSDGDLPEEGVAVDKLMDHTVTYHLRYPLPVPPTHLIFQQTFGSDGRALPAVMELEVRQKGLAISDTVTLSNGGEAQTIDFDWQAKDRPDESAEDAWRRRREERRQERMGIESYDAIYGFIYIVDHEVRIELLLPLLTLETWLEVERKDADFLEPAEQLAARPALEQFLCAKNVVKIDGVQVKPTLQRLDFYGLKFSDFALRPDPQRLSALTARVGAILSYSTKGPPSKVDIKWEYFNAAVFMARTALYAYDKTLSHQFSAYRPVFSWQNPGVPALPRIVTLDVGRGGRTVKDNEAQAIAGTLLRNVYRAFDYRDESDIYDALARSVHGELLADLYLKIHKGLIMQEQGAAVSRVENVEIDKCAFKGGDARGFSVDLTWTVEGTVEHWGHIHKRVNRYTAGLTIRPVDGAWRIVAMEVQDQKRVRYQVKLRSF